MPKTIKLVIFDLDGTLIDAYPAIIKSFNFTMKSLKNAPQDDVTIRRAVGWGDKNLLRPFVKKGELKKALSIYRQHHTKALRQKTRFLPGAKPLLHWLRRRGYKLAVASNRPTKFSHIVLGHLKIKGYFDYIICGDKIKKAKPHPDILFCILKKFSLKPNEALYVGDMTVDVVAGKRAGVKTVAVLSGSSTRKEITEVRPYRIVKNVSFLAKFLQNGRVL